MIQPLLNTLNTLNTQWCIQHCPIHLQPLTPTESHPEIVFYFSFRLLIAFFFISLFLFLLRRMIDRKWIVNLSLSFLSSLKTNDEHGECIIFRNVFNTRPFTVRLGWFRRAHLFNRYFLLISRILLPCILLVGCCCFYHFSYLFPRMRSVLISTRAKLPYPDRAEFSDGRRANAPELAANDRCTHSPVLSTGKCPHCHAPYSLVKDLFIEVVIFAVRRVRQDLRSCETWPQVYSMLGYSGCYRYSRSYYSEITTGTPE